MSKYHLQSILNPITNQINNIKKTKNVQQNGTFFPSVSLSQLQQNVYSKKKKHHRSSTNIAFIAKYHYQDIQIKSPFYERTNCLKHQNCKCQYHKRQKASIPKLVFKSKPPLQQLNLLKTGKLRQKILKTASNDEQLSNKLIKKSHPRFKSMMQSQESTKKQVILCDMFGNTFDTQGNFKNINKLFHQQATKQYNEYIKNLKLSGSSDVDHRNIQYQQYLKTHYLYILDNKNKRESSKKNSTIISRESGKRRDTKFSKYKTCVSEENDLGIGTDEVNEGSSRRSGYSNSSRGSDKLRSKSKQKSTMSIGQEITERLENSYFKKSIVGSLKEIQKGKLQALMKDFYQQFVLTPTSDNEGEEGGDNQVNFFSILCQKLLSKDKKAIEQAKKMLKSISHLPMGAFEAIFKGINAELKSGFYLSGDLEADDIEKVVSQAMNEVESNIEFHIKSNKQKKGKQKLQLIDKMKKKFTGRHSLGLYKLMEYGGVGKSNKKWRLSNISKRKSGSGQTDQGEGKGTDSQGYDPNGINSSVPDSRFAVEKQQKQGSKQVKKVGKLRKLKRTDQIISKIDKQIQQEMFRHLPQKSPSLMQENEYLRRRNESQQKIKDEDDKRHQQFLTELQRKQKERQSSTLSTYEMKRNDARAHIKRNKIFLKKMQVSLASLQLQTTVIRVQDHILTKKRKLRLLKQLTKEENVKDSDLCKQLQKYIQIYENNVNLLVKNKKQSQQVANNKYSKRRRNTDTDQHFFEYDVPQQPFKPTVTYKNEQQTIESIFSNRGKPLGSNDLKFYNLQAIDLQDEDLQSLILKLTSTTTYKKKCLIRHRNIWLPKNVLQIIQQGQQYSNKQTLMQRGIQHKHGICQRKQYSSQQQEEIKQTQSIVEYKDPIENMQQKFNLKLAQYKKVLLKGCSSN